MWVHGRGEGRLCLSIHPLCLTAQRHRQTQGVEEARQTDKWTEPSGQDALVKAPSLSHGRCKKKKKLGSDSVTESRAAELNINKSVIKKFTLMTAGRVSIGLPKLQRSGRIGY